jgi:hypothetical protein
MITEINSEDRAVQRTFAEYSRQKLGRDSLYALNRESFGPDSLPGRESIREVVLARDLRTAIEKIKVAAGTALFGRPPARIRTCSVTASGSYVGCLLSKRSFGYGCRIVRFGGQRAAG